MSSPNDAIPIDLANRSLITRISLKLLGLFIIILLILIIKDTVKAQQGIPTNPVTLNASVYLEPESVTGINPTEIQDFFTQTNQFIQSRNADTATYGNTPLKLNLGIRSNSIDSTSLVGTGMGQGDLYCDMLRVPENGLTNFNLAINFGLVHNGATDDFILCVHDERVGRGNYFFESSNRIYLYSDTNNSNPLVFTDLYHLYDNDPLTAGEDVGIKIKQTFVHEFAHLLSLPDAYWAERIEWDGLATNIPGPLTIAGASIPKYEDYFPDMNYTDIISSKLLTDTNAWFNPVDLKYLNYRLKQIEDLNRGPNGGMSYNQITQTSNDWTYAQVQDRVLSNGIKFQLPQTLSGTNVTWEYCSFIEGTQSGSLDGSAPRTVLNTVRIFEQELNGEYVFEVPVDKLEHTKRHLYPELVSALNCKPVNGSHVFFWFAAHSYKEAYLDFFTSSDYANVSDKYNKIITATLECVNPHDWCRYDYENQLEYVEDEVSIYAIDVVSIDNIKELTLNLDTILKQASPGNAEVALLLPNGSYRLFNSSYTTPEVIKQKLLDYAKYNTTFNTSPLDYESLRKIVNNQQDFYGNTLPNLNKRRNIYVITDKSPNTTAQQALINDANTKNVDISVVYVGKETHPSSYTTVSNSTGGKSLDKGTQQKVSERLEDLIDVTKRNYYTNFTSEILSGVPGLAPLTVRFQAKSYNGYTQSNSSNFKWDFDSNGSIDATGQTVTHTYNTVGKFNVTLYASESSKSDKKIIYGLQDTLTSQIESDFVWSRKINRTINPNVNNILTLDGRAEGDRFGNVYVTGSFNDRLDLGGGIVLNEIKSVDDTTGTVDSYIAKYNSAGFIVWAKQIDSKFLGVDSVRDMQTNGNGYSIIVGRFNDSVNIAGNEYEDIIESTRTQNSNSMFLTLFDPSGNEVWTRILGSNGIPYMDSIDIDDYNNVILSGSQIDSFYIDDEVIIPHVSQTQNTSNSFKPRNLIKLDSSGNVDWAVTPPGVDQNVSTIVEVDSVGGIYVVGYETDTESTPKYKQYFLAKYSSTNGTQLWRQTYPSQNTNMAVLIETYIEDIEVDYAGNIYLQGRYNTTLNLGGQQLTHPLSTGESVMIAKLDTNGAKQWIHTNPRDDRYEVRYGDLEIASNGDLIFTGSIESSVYVDEGNSIVYSRNGASYTVSPSTNSTAMSFVGAFSPTGIIKWVSEIDTVDGVNNPREHQFAVNYQNHITGLATGPGNAIYVYGDYIESSKFGNTNKYNLFGNGLYDFHRDRFMAKIVPSSKFAFNSGGWFTASSAPVNYSTSGYVSLTNVANTEAEYFQAPSTLFDELSSYFGTKLKFSLKQSVATNQNAANKEAIAIKGYGGKTVYAEISNPGTGWTDYSVKLDTSTPWKNRVVYSAPLSAGENDGDTVVYENATVEELTNIFNNIENIEILGTFSTDAHSVDLANFDIGESDYKLEPSFGTNLTSATTSQVINFTDTSSATDTTITGWKWDFNNDGTVDSTTQNPSHTYIIPGQYDAKLEITDGVNSYYTQKTIVIDGPPASIDANFTSNVTSISADGTVNFTDTSTVISTIATTWAWDFNNDGTVDSTVQNPSYVFGTAGTYTVKLTVGDGAISNSETKTNFITVTAGIACTQLEYVTDDTYARSGTYAGNTHGSELTMYTKDGGANYDRYAYLRFDLSNTDYTTISNAKLRLFVDNIAMTYTEQPIVNFYDVTDNTWTESALTWNNKPALGNSLLSWNVVNTQEKTWLEIDLTSYIQAQLNGDRIVNIGTWDINAANEEVEFSTKESINKPFLEITGLSSECPAALQEGTYELDRQVNSSYDDGSENITQSGDMYRTRSELFLTRPWHDDVIETAMRFQNVTIPQGATIKSAYLEMVAYETEGSVANLNVYGEDVDNASTLNYTQSNITTRTKTSSFYNWTNLSVWNQNSAYRTGDLKAVVQEIVDRSGWTSGNSMMFIINGTGDRTVYSQNGSTTYAPKLHIEYDL